jgi:hypothetical protein
MRRHVGKWISDVSKVHCPTGQCRNTKETEMIFPKLTFAAVSLVFSSGALLAQEWTLDEDQLVEQPALYSPYVDEHFPRIDRKQARP